MDNFLFVRFSSWKAYQLAKPFLVDPTIYQHESRYESTYWTTPIVKMTCDDFEALKKAMPVLNKPTKVKISEVIYVVDILRLKPTLNQSPAYL